MFLVSSRKGSGFVTEGAHGMVLVSSHEGALDDCMRAVVAHEPVIPVPLHDTTGQLEHRLTAYGSAQSVAPEVAARDGDHPRPSQE